MVWYCLSLTAAYCRNRLNEGNLGAVWETWPLIRGKPEGQLECIRFISVQYNIYYVNNCNLNHLLECSEYALFSIEVPVLPEITTVYLLFPGFKKHLPHHWNFFIFTPFHALYII